MTLTQRNPMQVENLERRRMLAGTPWGQQAKLIGQDLLAAQYPHLNGAGQSVVVIDQGVNYTHPAINGKMIAGHDFAANDTNPWADGDPHGTGVAAMMVGNGFDYAGAHYQGIAPGAKLIVLRSYSSTDAAEALQWVVANKARYNIAAVNLVDRGIGGTAAIFRSMVASINALASQNVLVTIPSGNTGGTNVPSYGGNEVSAASTNVWGGVAGSSVRGGGLDFLAPADRIALPYWQGKAIWTNSAVGTSWASPQIAGAAAVIRQIKPTFTNAQVVSILKDSGTKIYDSKTGLTFPLINLYKAVQLAYSRIGQAAPAPAPAPIPTPAPTPAPAPTAPAGSTASTYKNVANGTVLQVEDFDAGVNGVAFKESDIKNFGGNNYRTGTGVDISTINDGGSTRAVTGIRPGEWLRYSVNVTTAGTYTVEFRLAAVNGGTFHLEVDGKNVTGAIGAGSGASWSAFRSVFKTLNLTAGKHTLHLKFDANGASGGVGIFNYMKFTTGTPVAAPAAATAPVGPFATINLTPGVKTYVQAENFDKGARGTAYFDTDTRNETGKYRTDTGVDVAVSTDSGGGYVVGKTRKGEWLNYTVNVAKAGTYTFDVRQAYQYAGGAFHIEVDGKNVTGALAFKSTGSFNNWAEVRKTGVALTAGKHTIRLVVDSVGAQGVGANINWIRIF
ncbi:MAG TPA: carbohydrate-binding protein [Tepidisphaeraceae bacterium]|nr:carbohydrate-binding protein [Tepidisphaeraceae bacterium]